MLCESPAQLRRAEQRRRFHRLGQLFMRPKLGRLGRDASDASRVEERHRRGEDVASFEEEGPLLWELNLFVREIQNELIRLDLGEVGEEGEVEREVALRVPLRIDAERAAE